MLQANVKSKCAGTDSKTYLRLPAGYIISKGGSSNEKIQFASDTDVYNIYNSKDNVYYPLTEGSGSAINTLYNGEALYIQKSNGVNDEHFTGWRVKELKVLVPILSYDSDTEILTISWSGSTIADDVAYKISTKPNDANAVESFNVGDKITVHARRKHLDYKLYVSIKENVAGLDLGKWSSEVEITIPHKPDLIYKNEELVKNDRFKRGGTVDIYFAPIYSGRTLEFKDTSSGGKFKLEITTEEDITPERIEVGDIASLSFGAAPIIAKSSNSITVEFQDSAFPEDNIMAFVGTHYQALNVFKKNERILKGLLVDKFKEEVKASTYGASQIAYHMEYKDQLILTEIQHLTSFEIGQLLTSKSLVVKSCDDSLHHVNYNDWQGNFPIGLAGATIDPVYRTASLDKRITNIKRLKNKTKVVLNMLG